MFIGMSKLGSMVIDVNGQRLDAKFIRETGEIDDYFTIIKGAAPEPVRFATFTIEAETLRASWKSAAGKRYRIERKNALDNTEWISISDIITASGATSRWSGSATPGVDQSFYRVAQLE